MKRTLLLNPPSFQDFDGGAGSRYQATREVTSFWYPTWLCYPAGLIPESRVVDAPPENLTVAQVAALAPDFEVAVLFTTSPLCPRPGHRQPPQREEPRAPGGTGGAPGEHPGPGIPGGRSPGGFCGPPGVRLHRPGSGPGPALGGDPGAQLPHDGRIHHNPDRPFIEDLDALPFVTDIYHRDLTIEHYQIPYLRYPYVSIYTGRGCPHHCVYCLWPQTFTGRRYRVRSVANVVAEVRRALELFPQAAEIFFDDDTFTADGERARRLSRELAAP